MVNFADCVSKVQCRNLVTNTPTKDGISALLKATTSVNKTSQNGFKLGGLTGIKPKDKSILFSSHNEVIVGNLFLNFSIPIWELSRLT